MKDGAMEKDKISWPKRLSHEPKLTKEQEQLLLELLEGTIFKDNCNLDLDGIPELSAKFADLLIENLRKLKQSQSDAIRDRKGFDRSRRRSLDDLDRIHRDRRGGQEDSNGEFTDFIPPLFPGCFSVLMVIAATLLSVLIFIAIY